MPDHLAEAACQASGQGHSLHKAGAASALEGAGVAAASVVAASCDLGTLPCPCALVGMVGLGARSHLGTRIHPHLAESPRVEVPCQRQEGSPKEEQAEPCRRHQGRGDPKAGLQVVGPCHRLEVSPREEEGQAGGRHRRLEREVRILHPHPWLVAAAEVG